MPKIKVEAQYLGVYKVPTAVTNSYPSKVVSYRTEGYNYQVKLIISFPDYSPFIDSLYGIICILPDYSEQKNPLRKTEIVKLSDREYTYSFPLRINENGWIKVFIASNQEMLSNIDVRFYKSTSNKERIYLSSSNE